MRSFKTTGSYTISTIGVVYSTISDREEDNSLFKKSLINEVILLNDKQFLVKGVETFAKMGIHKNDPISFIGEWQ